MTQKELNSDDLGFDEDWVGNNVAFKCPVCKKTFIVSGILHPNGRRCPGCGKSIGYCNGGKNTGGTATIKW
jgi:predicted RNA-binding Zn-ribbon protein involved in translation (DUF1610 family)